MQTRRVIASLLVGTVLAFGSTGATPAFAQGKAEAAAKALQKKAMEEDYLGTDFTKAQDKLEKALAQCGTSQCSPAVRAALHRDLGVVQIGGEIDKDKGAQHFAEALKIDPSIQLDPDVKTKALEAAFEAAKKQGQGGASAAPSTDASGEPSGDFDHTPVASQQVRTPVPIYVEYPGEENLVKVVARYKGFGMTDWKSIDLKKMGESGWGGQIPCADVELEGVAQYYLQGFNADNDPVATSGDRNNPFKVALTREKPDQAPSLPGQSPPTQCAGSGDCPPDFPGCKAKKKKGKASSEESSGKDGGEFCEEDNECKSGLCDNGQCAEDDEESSGPTRKVWIGVFGAFDYSFIPSAENVCKLSPTSEGQLPLNDSNYYCVDTGGNDYPFRRAPSATNPRDYENDALQPTATDGYDKVSGGGAFGNVRLMVSLDYALSNNWLIGARLGYVLNTYPGQAGGDDGKTFPPIHLEARGTYLFGKDALTKKFAPYGFLGGGVATFDTKIPVTVSELDPATSRIVRKQVNAWNVAGPGFVALGGGVRIGFAERFAFMGGLRFNVAFGNAAAPSIGPEVGLLYGF